MEAELETGDQAGPDLTAQSHWETFSQYWSDPVRAGDRFDFKDSDFHYRNIGSNVVLFRTRAMAFINSYLIAIEIKLRLFGIKRSSHNTRYII